MSEYDYEDDGYTENLAGGELGVPFGADAYEEPDYGQEPDQALEGLLANMSPQERDQIGEAWRASTAARAVLEQQQLAEQALEGIEQAKRERGRMGDPEQIVENFSTVFDAAATEALAMGYSGEQIAEEIRANPELLGLMKDAAVDSAHWDSLIAQTKSSINPAGEAHKRLSEELADFAGGE